MNLLEIRQECRQLARDFHSEDYLWSDEELNRHINRVYWRIATETRCIRDATTPDICIIESSPVDYTTLAEGSLDYIWANDPGSWLYQTNVCPYNFKLHKSIIDIEEVKWANRQWKLQKVSVNKWRTNPWWERVKGMPTEYCTDYQHGFLTLNFRDEATDYLSLSVRRSPIVQLVEDEDVPEFKENYHDFFLNGVLWYMYSKPDSESFDAAKADKHYGLFKLDMDEIKQQESQMDNYLRPNYSMSAFR
jgi:hypothetical protein